MSRRTFSFRTIPLFLSLSLVAAALTACARPPVQEMAGARVAISAARAAGAETRAPAPYAQANRLFDQSLRDVEASDYDRARRHAIEARKIALMAEEDARRASRLEEPAPREKGEKNGAAPEPEALASLKSREGQGPPKAGKDLPSSAARPVDRHRVVQGESLWKISGYAQVYNDPFQWPLLYRANREKISDPDLVYPDQELSVPRRPGSEEVAEAVRVAKSRGPWSLWDGR
ncbi:MAG: DUF4398 domain-containing protein [Candidatus Tectomicrobia bacterium]|nr:DUF4398 domain-containing protein [Candidatus Tectomicrobia bacterium]